MKYAKEITGGVWYGVAIPPWLRAFDCRAPDDEPWPVAPWGATLIAGEKAAVDLGLKRGFWDDDDSTTPLSCLTYIDARSADEAELRRQVESMVYEATKLHDEYERAKEKLARMGNPHGGGGCHYMPVAIEMSNYGWGIICDKRTCVVVPFGS